MKLYTIGHSNHSLERFVQLLAGAEIGQVVDVRTAPHSRYNPQFNRGHLERALPRHHIAYIFAGQHLGGRPSDPACYKRRSLPAEDADYLHAVDYPEVMRQAWFLAGIERLLALAAEQTTAIMCSEEDPAECHRHHLIAKFLLREHRGVAVRHIRGDGNLVNAAAVLASVEDAPGQQLPLL